MSVKAKTIKGHGLGTNMQWLCVVHNEKGFGFGTKAADRAITCIDMTVHAPEHDHPHVVISERIKHDHPRMFPKAFQSPEQVAFAETIKKNWNKLKSGQTIDVDKILAKEAKK